MTFTLNGSPTDVMVSADCFRGKDEPHVRGFEYGSITAPRAKDKLGMLEQLDVMVCKEDMPQPGVDEDRRFVPESTLRPNAPKTPVGELAGFLNADDAEDGSQRSKGSSKGASQPTQDSFRMSQPTQVSPKNAAKPVGLDLLSDDAAKVVVKPFAGINTVKNFFEPKQQGRGLGLGGQKRKPVEAEEVSDSTSDSSATSDSDATSDGGSESDATKKRKLKKKKDAKKKKAKKAKKAKKEKEAKKKKVATPKKTKKAEAEDKKEEIKQGVATILLQLCYFFL